MSKPAKIVFIKVGLNSYLNAAVEKILRDSFPEYSLVTLDVRHDLFGSSLKAVSSSAVFALRQYGVSAFRQHNSIFNNFYTEGYFRAVRRMVRDKIDPDEFLFSFQTQSLFDASVSGLPHFVYTDHTHLANLGYPGFDLKNLAPQAWIDLEHEIYRSAAMVFTMSSNISGSLTDQYNVSPEKIACVYGGCDLARDADNAGSFERSGKNILFTGKDWHRKGGPELIAAFVKIKQSHPETTLKIVGCVPEVSLPDGVSAPGRISRKELVECYRDAMIFCLPTKMEPFGLAILEAMAFGLPVIATGIGAIPDMVEHGVTGFLAPPDDSDALAAELEKLLSDSELCREFGKRGRERILERYNWDSVGEKISRHICDVLKRRDGEQGKKLRG